MKRGITMIEKVFKCASCEHVKPMVDVAGFSEKIAGRGERYICKECAAVKSYNTANNKAVHKKAEHGFKFGCEFECVPFSESDHLAMCSSSYNLIPTRDSSLPFGGIEYKTGTIRNASAVKSMLRSFEKHVDFSYEQCGQHINFSSDMLEECDYNAIYAFRHELFDTLREYMKQNPDEVLRVCGRNETPYCSLENTEYSSHGTWLNLSHCYYDTPIEKCRLELRIAKVASPNQYVWLIFMCRDILDCIATNFIPYIGSSVEDHKATITANKLVKVFQKYANGKAICQRPERNSK